MALTDELTGLHNRHFMMEHGTIAWGGIARGENLAIAMVDLDHFKQINDTCGHAEGDKALRGTASTARVIFRSSDALGRYGGEEFLIIMSLGNSPMTSDQASETVNSIVGRFSSALREIERPDNKKPLTASIGVVVALGHSAAGRSMTFEDAIKKADRLLYDVKASGRDGVKIEVLLDQREV